MIFHNEIISLLFISFITHWFRSHILMYLGCALSSYVVTIVACCRVSIGFIGALLTQCLPFFIHPWSLFTGHYGNGMECGKKAMSHRGNLCCLHRSPMHKLGAGGLKYLGPKGIPCLWILHLCTGKDHALIDRILRVKFSIYVAVIPHFL